MSAENAEAEIEKYNLVGGVALRNRVIIGNNMPDAEGIGHIIQLSGIHPNVFKACDWSISCQNNLPEFLSK